MTLTEIKSLVAANADKFHAAAVCFDCREVYDEFSKKDSCQQCGNHYAPTKEKQNCPECGREHYDSLCPECESSDVMYLTDVLDVWNGYVEDVEKDDLRKKIEKFVKEKTDAIRTFDLRDSR